jgi:phosphatidylinositol glycan class M
LFVTFNKVCTSQYFIWYWVFVPLIWRAPHGIYISYRQLVIIILVWFGSQALWLSNAYALEFMGIPVFYSLWICSAIFFVVNTWIASVCIRNYNKTIPSTKI